MEAKNVRLLLQMDDAGSCPSANQAIADALDFGLARSAGIMAPAPAFPQAVQLLKERPKACVGVHATLNAEWETTKWGPVLGAYRVPSLVDAKGKFMPTPLSLHEKGFQSQEALAELDAQVQKVKDAGLMPVYLDSHMGFTWLAGLAEGMRGLARTFGLSYRPDCQWVGPDPETEGSLLDRIVARLDKLEPGTYIMVFHPAYDSPETREFWHEGLSPGGVAKERDAEARLLTDPAFKNAIEDREIELIDHRVLADEARR